MEVDNLKIGWIGTGKMGSPMSACLAKAGFSVSVFDIDSGNMQASIDSGAKGVNSKQELVMESDIVFSMIPNDAALLNVALDDDGILSSMTPGSTYVDMSTVSPYASENIAKESKTKNIDFLCAPVSGSTILAEQGNLTIMASGSSKAYDMAKGLFDIIGSKNYYVGTDQQALYLKLSINLLAASTVAALAEATTLGRKGGVDWDLMLDVMNESVIASPLLKYSIPPLKKRAFSPAFAAEQMNKDMGLIVKAAEDVDVPVSVALMVRDLYRSIVEDGHGSENLTIAVREIEKAAGLGEPS